MDLNELKAEIAGILSEAKKKKEKADRLKKDAGRAANAYGMYDEEHDFSAPLGAYNRYAQQGQVNWGPMTSRGVHIDQDFKNPNLGMHESEERALRRLVREVIENGLVPDDSAWSAMLEHDEPLFESTWEEALHWYDHRKLGLGQDPKKVREALGEPEARGGRVLNPVNKKEHPPATFGIACEYCGQNAVEKDPRTGGYICRQCGLDQRFSGLAYMPPQV